MRRFRLALLNSLPCTLSVVSFLPAQGAGPDSGPLPTNVNGGLRHLVAWHQAQPRTLANGERRTRFLARFPDAVRRPQTDPDATRAVVDVTLDGTVPPAAVRGALAALGAEVFSRSARPTGGPGGILSVRLPLDTAPDAARLPGVASLSLVRPAHHWAGKATSQGKGVLHANTLNTAGFDGTGLTVGVISDSFDAGTTDLLGNPVATHAAADVLSGDLPGPGNPDGRLTPVYVLADADPSDRTNTDEGRAMLQIVHDLAPGATLAFATSGATPTALAANIRALRTSPAARCDVIVDDAQFDEEPFFSDGPAALAVQDVVRSAGLAGRRVLYYAAAGNRGRLGSYDATFRPVADETARASAQGNLRLDQVPTELTAGGFHNFDPGVGRVALSQKLGVSGADASFNFQWDDPWVPGLVSTSYSLLVFDAEGNYLPDLSGTDDAIRMGRAIQLVDLPLGAERAPVTYQLAVCRRLAGLQQATHLRYLVNTPGAVTTRQFLSYNVPTVYGHAAAVGADAVAAYAWNVLDSPEPFTSAGPVTVYLDTNGLRLAAPDVRLQPTLAAVDGVNTTFVPPGLGSDADGDGTPNFFGTSAAAAHAGAVAALLLQAAGGHGSLDDIAMRALLQSTAAAHDLDPAGAAATATDAKGVHTVTLTATGDGSDFAAFDKKFFQLRYAATAGTSELRKVVLDLGPAGAEFDPDPVTGFPFKVSKPDGTVRPADVTAEFRGANPAHPAKLALTFAPRAFLPGSVLSFGVDRDLQSIHAGGNSADVLAGAKIKAIYLDDNATKGRIVGKVVNQIGQGDSPTDGFGLIDAAAALRKLRGTP